MYAQRTEKTLHLHEVQRDARLMSGFPLFRVFIQSISELCGGSMVFNILGTMAWLAAPTLCKWIVKFLQGPCSRLTLVTSGNQGGEARQRGFLLGFLTLNFKGIWIFTPSPLWREMTHQNSLDQNFSAWHRWHLELSGSFFFSLCVGGEAILCILGYLAVFLPCSH